MNGSLLASRANAALLTGIAGIVVGIGVLAHDAGAYYCIALPVLLQVALWFRAGAQGLPVLPLIFALFYVYYAIPLLRGEAAIYTPDELTDAAVAVGGFLLAANLVSLPFLFGMRRRAFPSVAVQIADRQVLPIVLAGLASGVVYHLGVLTNRLEWLGTSIGIVRAAMLTLAGLACYLLGYARGRRILVGGSWLLAVSGFVFLILLSLTNLLLSDGLVLSLALLLGYVLTTGRVPWVSLAIGTVLLVVLHAGKFEVRDQYWIRESSTLRSTPLVRVPGMMAEWFAAGVEALESHDAPSDILQRASLLHMLLLVQRNTPDLIPYLGGKTYTQLPSMLLPRFIEPDKETSQAGLNLLSIRYQLQTEDSVERTTIGWGLIAEAYANFGYWAVLAVGAIFGALCGTIMWLSAGAAATSWRMLVAVPATLVLSNLEANFSLLLVTLAQAMLAALGVVALSRLAGVLRRQPRPAPARRWPEAPSPLRPGPVP